MSDNLICNKCGAETGIMFSLEDGLVLCGDCMIVDCDALRAKVANFGGVLKQIAYCNYSGSRIEVIDKAIRALRHQ